MEFNIGWKSFRKFKLTLGVKFLILIGIIGIHLVQLKFVPMPTTTRPFSQFILIFILILFVLKDKKLLPQTIQIKWLLIFGIFFFFSIIGILKPKI